ncbi:hypothetical protein T07_5010 [Trichinella nelsoni]|uniref:Uncharacterized protein n=1 Tax=Trichinella nelsoni TaxID=6336 RepID=A0A0V0RC32_9BILA|nr:hypothetical protein T07_8283 [Trichinella nelsoni]KRX12151.1 hypothetical protein T07_5010 [Trichinella nelsoni]
MPYYVCAISEELSCSSLSKHVVNYNSALQHHP